MAQLYTIGWAASEPRHGTSVNQNPYTMFSLGEHIGYGQRARTQYYQVWARGDVMHRLQKAGVKKGSLLWVAPLDMLIAAHAKSENIILVTNNTREFERVPGLELED